MSLRWRSVKRFLRKTAAFIRRDFLIAVSYKLAFALQVLGIVFTVLLFFFFAKVIGEGEIASGYFKGYDPFEFFLIGIAFMNYFNVALRTFGRSIREGQLTGTLELMLASPTRLPVILLASGAGNFLVTTVHIFVYLIVGVALGVDLGRTNPLGALLTLILTIVTTGALGILAASFVMIFKRGDPITAVLGRVAPMLAGVFIPLSVFHKYAPGLLVFSYALPITYSLEAMRRSVRGAPLAEIAPYLLALVGFAAVLLPLSMAVFSYAVRKARIDGTLIQY